MTENPGIPLSEICLKIEEATKFNVSVSGPTVCSAEATSREMCQWQSSGQQSLETVADSGRQRNTFVDHAH